jgi:hypothetical protein
VLLLLVVVVVVVLLVVVLSFVVVVVLLSLIVYPSDGKGGCRCQIDIIHRFFALAVLLVFFSCFTCSASFMPWS